jgi:hypothetical protein
MRLDAKAKEENNDRKAIREKEFKEKKIRLSIQTYKKEKRSNKINARHLPGMRQKSVCLYMQGLHASRKDPKG